MEYRKTVICKVLFVIQKKFGIVPSNNLQNIIASFYYGDEIWNGKTLLFEIATNQYGAKKSGRCI